MLSKQQFLKECLEKEVGHDTILLACESGPRGIKAREKFVYAMSRCQKRYCEAAAVDQLLEAVNAGRADANTILQIIQQQGACQL